ncbi:MAG: CD225/dispanin family protein [Armatimonadota bacterium]
MFCKKCGAENPDNVQYCAKCGTPTSWQPVPQNQPQGPQTPPPPGPPQGYPNQQPGYQAPPPPYGAGGGPQIQNYMVWSVITTVCCCLPLGIFAIIKSSEVNTKLSAGDYAAAQSASDLTRTLNLVGMIGGGILTVIAIIIQVAALSAAGQL